MPRKGSRLTDRNREMIKKWHAENTENLSIGLRKGKRDAYKRLAAARGVSVAGMIQEYMDREYEATFGEPPLGTTREKQ